MRKKSILIRSDFSIQRSVKFRVTRSERGILPLVLSGRQSFSEDGCIEGYVRYVTFIVVLFTNFSVSAGELATYEQAVVRNPDDHRALYNVGVVAFKQDDLHKAQSAFNYLKSVSQEGVWDSGRCEQVYYNAGNTEIKLQHYADAVESFETVLHYNPDNEIARQKLEFAKKMLEQQQQQEQQKNDQNSDNQEQQDSENNEQKQDQNEQHNNDAQDDRNQQDQQQEQNQGDQQGQQDDQDNHNHQDQQKQEEDNQQLNQHEQDNQADEKDNQSGPELSEQEQRLMTALQAHDENMSKEMGQRMLRGAAGSYGQNNW